MASTRQAPFIDIFVDGGAPTGEPSLDTAQHPSGPFDLNDFTSFPAAQDEGHPLPSKLGRSPVKHQGHTNPPLRAVLGEKPNVSLSAPTAPTFTTDSPVKRPAPVAYQPIAPQPPPEKMYLTYSGQDKENVVQPYRSDNFAEFSGPSSGTLAQKGHRKRISAEMGSDDRKDSKKARCAESEPPEPVQIPEPHEMPAVPDPGCKPSISYANLIGMSILRAPNRRLTLAQIYKWISDTFGFYRTTESGWQNSIRHNLSLHKAFIKKERPKDDPGKGHYWAIEPGMEGMFLSVGRDKASRRPPSSSHGPKSTPQPTSEINVPSSSTGLLPLPPASKPEARVQPSDAREPSSDATIPASDPALFEEDEETSKPPPLVRGPHSSPPQAIRSSPPCAHQRRRSREDTPGMGPELSSDIHGSRHRKRKFNSMNDSGYFSSLESSALRPGHGGGGGFGSSAMEKADASSHRFKRGRAEEELARLRSSQDISPSKTKANAALYPPTQQPLMSSSPVRPATADSQAGPGLSTTHSLMLPPPLTPAIALKKRRVAPLPPSVSPNTNLRNHRNTVRELMGSPIKAGQGMTPLGAGSLSFSPSFQLADEHALTYAYDEPFRGPTNFAIYRDPAEASPIGLGRLYAGVSPDKRADPPALSPLAAAKRASPSVGGVVLADITGAAANTGGRATAGAGDGSVAKLGPNPALRPPHLGSPLRFRPSPGRSPSKALLSATTAAVFDAEDDFFGGPLDLFSSVGVGGGIGGGGSGLGAEDDEDSLEFMKRMLEVSDGDSPEKENAQPARKKAKKHSGTARPALGARRETARF